MNVCVFGASGTWGMGDPEGGGWVARLKRFFDLRANQDYHDHSNVRIYNLGVSGATTFDLLERFNVEAKARRPAVIIISIGSNDAVDVDKIGKPRESESDFSTNLRKLVKIGRKFTDKIIFLGLPPVDQEKTSPIPWNKRFFYTQERIERFDSLVRDLCEREKLVFISMLEILTKKDLLDGLHTNSGGHEKIFQKVMDTLISKGVLV